MKVDEVVRIAYYVPMSVEAYEEGLSIRWHLFGTSGDPRLDARYAAQDAEWRQPLASWESEGGAL